MKMHILSLLLLSSHFALADTTLEQEGTVTVPLKSALSLLKEPGRSPELKPPTQAVINKSILSGNLTREALVLKAHFEVTVLGDAEGWSKLPLLEMGPNMYVTGVGDIQNAVIASVDGQLCFMSKVAGAYAFDVELMVRARREGALSHVTLKASPQVRSPTARMPLERWVTSSKAEWVTTLEGKLSSRVVYALQLEGPEEIALTVPEKHALMRLLVNGVVQKLPATDKTVKVSVFPQELGSTQGTLEVIIARELGVFHLSGELTLHLPALSWPISEVLAQAHLPAVFQYVRQGGSLEAFDVSSETPGSHYPGIMLQFRQHLVQASAPNVELSYSVNLENKYFQRHAVEQEPQ